MLTKLTVRNFKRFDDVEIGLSSSVVFIGPNNSGKTTALQALALWDAGCKQWLAKRQSSGDAAKGVTIGRKDLVYLPLPASNALWRDLRVREAYREDGKTKPRNVLIEIIVDGLDGDGEWSCGFEFEYASEEFFYCRPLRVDDGKKPARMPVPVKSVQSVELAFLPPMTGLLMEEPLLQPGRINVLLGSGRSGETLRNICYSVFERQDGGWDKVVSSVAELFGVRLREPVFVGQTGTIEIEYEEQRSGVRLPLTSAGLGMQQTLLLLAYLHLKPSQVLLLDEPDAHLEILRQRQIYQLLVELSALQGSQVICASHSEVVLNEAVERDTVVAFVGKPHVVSGRQGSQILKALKDIGFEHYMQAEQSGWVLYLEGSTDLAILRAWANKLEHPAREALSKPYVHYLNTNLPSVARNHFNAVKEANPRLLGVAVFDKLDKEPQGPQDGFVDLQWSRREIENYVADPAVLMAFARGNHSSDDLIEQAEWEQRVDAMREAIAEVETATQTLGENLWSDGRKASEQVLPQIFQRYRQKCLDVRIPVGKGEFHKLVEYQSAQHIHPDVVAMLDAILKTYKEATKHV
ncbi:MAG: AAA family ATPase [Hydrogenophaga sp.]|nr:AAA family ATPase [Hydrogenophaga sp.]